MSDMDIAGNIDAAPVADASDYGAAVPVIDLAVPDADDAIARACAEWGFFQVVGHGLGSADAAMAEARRFFHQDKPAKRALSRSRDNPWGFYDRELTKNARDKKEVFDIGPDAGQPAAAGGSFSGDPFSGATPWPADGGFQGAMTAHFRACERLSRRLIAAISRGLGAPIEQLEAAFRPAHTSFLRLNYYPVDDPLAGEAKDSADLGIHHHTDAGALTVLLQDEVSGLQVYRDGLWHDIAPRPGALVINIGDMVQVWSNDLYRAPIHRVLAMERAERFSLPFFYNPAYEAVVAPLEATASSNRPARYSGFSWGEFRRKRADGDFGNYGAEVQISDYRL